MEMTIELAFAIDDMEFFRKEEAHEFDNADESQAWNTLVLAASKFIADAKAEYLRKLRGGMPTK